MRIKKQMLPIATFSVLAVFWELMARFSGWDETVFPGPVVVMQSMWELVANGSLIKHTVASLFRVTAGFYLAILFGFPLGILLGRKRVINDLFNPVVQFLRPISPLAWIPLAMLWFGIGDMPAVFLIFLASFFPILVSTVIAVHGIKQTYFQVASNFSFNRYEVVTLIIIPAILPSFFTALRISVGIAWLVVVAAEMIAVRSGLGYLILDGRNALRMDYVMDSMIMIGVIGLGLDWLMRQLNRIESIFWGAVSR
ncbi:MAG TPA: ABC transporter permease [Thermodesulfovibrionia bacterium]|nr:ABC transporter permease [Thermodesulfovibrionia bacterium]